MEKLMQFVWQHRLWNNICHNTSDGKRVRIIHPGTLNSNSGPDFFNASVEIDGQRWVGNIEIHVKASDWFRHGHDRDMAYDSVILHVVLTDDTPVRRKNGEIIPQIAVKCSAEAAARCNTLMMNSAASLPCNRVIASCDSFFHTGWLTSLAFERLYNKSERILSLVEHTEGDWEAAAYITLARALGFGLNSEPFEVLAKNLPLKFLNRHRDELMTMEALIFGQAGMIPQQTPDETPYVARLREEYHFMSRKFNLHPLPLQWKMSRTRPQNFPHRRLALLAEKIHRGFHLIGRLDDIVTELERKRQAVSDITQSYYPHIEESTLQQLSPLTEIRSEFDIRLTGFWATRYTFGDSRGATPRALTDSSIDRLVINVAIPLMLARATSRRDTVTMELLPELLRGFKAEDNRDTRLFLAAGIPCRDAFDSQALIELRREYCEKNKCIYCRYGHKMLSQEIQS